MKILIIINDGAYGTEKAYNGLRIANQLGKEHQEVDVRIFLLGDAVSCAISHQNVPNGYYNLERMIKLSILKGAKVKLCGSCVDARGIKDIPLVEGTEISTLAELTNWIVDSDKVLTF